MAHSVEKTLKKPYLLLKGGRHKEAIVEGREEEGNIGYDSPPPPITRVT